MIVLIRLTSAVLVSIRLTAAVLFNTTAAVSLVG